MAAFAALSLLQRTGLSEEVSLPRYRTVGRPPDTVESFILQSSSVSIQRYLFIACCGRSSFVHPTRPTLVVYPQNRRSGGFLGSKGTAMASNRSCVSCTRRCGRLRGHAVFENIPCGLQDVPVLVSAHGTGP